MTGTTAESTTPDPDKPLPVPAKRTREKRGFFLFLAILALPIFNGLVKYTLIDREKLPATGPFVLSPNHNSNLDPIVVGVAIYKMKRNPRFLAKSSLFKVPFLGWLLRSSGQIPVYRGGGAKSAESLSAAQHLIENQSGVIVYPEGSLTRDPDLWPMRGKTGAVRLALEAGIPLIPAVQWGTHDLLPRYAKFPKLFPRTKVTIRIGDPVDLSDLRGKPLDTATLTQATDRLMARITVMLGEVRGETPPAERWDPSQHGQSETGRF